MNNSSLEKFYLRINLILNRFYSVQDEEYKYIVPEKVTEKNKHTQEDLFKHLVTAFYKFNRRFTHYLCIPLLQKDDKIIYCGVGRMPGLWIASAIRESHSSLVMSKEPIESLKLKRRPWESKYYSRQQHLVESSTRHLMRRELETYLGKCHFAMTKYGEILRITIPYNKKILIFVNTLPDFLDLWESYVLKLVRHIQTSKLLDELNQACASEVSALDDTPSKKKIFIKKFFDGNDINEIERIMLELFTYRHDDNNPFLDKVRYAAIVSKKSYPLGRYVKKDQSLLMTSYDELDHLVESVSRQRMRSKTIQFFGRVEYTFSVYDKIARLSIPLSDDYFLFVTLNHDLVEGKLSDDVLPTNIKNIFDFLNTLNSSYLK